MGVSADNEVVVLSHSAPERLLDLSLRGVLSVCVVFVLGKERALGGSWREWWMGEVDDVGGCGGRYLRLRRLLTRGPEDGLKTVRVPR
jgi:hypothetical protein